MIGLPAGTRIWLAAGVTDKELIATNLPDKMIRCIEIDPSFHCDDAIKATMGVLIP